MTHPGEQFYPQGVTWDDPIERGPLPDLLSQAARDYGDRAVLEFRDSPITYAALEDMVEVAASAYLRAGYGKGSSVALFLGNTPDHPINFFGALKAGARIVHLSPLDGEVALTHKLTDSGARVLVTSNLSALLPRVEVRCQGDDRPPHRVRGRPLGRGRHAADRAARQPRRRDLPAVRRRRREAGTMARDRRR